MTQTIKVESQGSSSSLPTTVSDYELQKRDREVAQAIMFMTYPPVAPDVIERRVNFTVEIVTTRKPGRDNEITDKVQALLSLNFPDVYVHLVIT